MSSKKEAIIARLNNREGVSYIPGLTRRSPKGYVVISNGDVCPLDTMDEIDYLHSISIDDNKLVCDTTMCSTNTEFCVYGKYDLKEAVSRYNNSIDQKLLHGETEDDDGSKIVEYHSF